MGLETGTYISDLNASNPVNATDPVSQGDDHLRLIKSTLLNTFPNVTGAATPTHTELNYLDGVTGVTGSGNLALAASPTFTGTLTAAAIAATTYDGITAANLVDKSASEVISGATWDFQAITAVSFGGIASANLLDKSATESISGDWSFSGTVALNGTVTGLSTADLSDGASIALLSDNETVTGDWDFNGSVAMSDEVVTDGVSTVSTTGTINALSTANVSVIRMTGASQVTLNGMANGVAGKRVIIINQSALALLMNSESASATAANRLRFAGSASISVGDAFEFIYDGVSSRWQLIGF